jgi:hypothetical protein
MRWWWSRNVAMRILAIEREQPGVTDEQCTPHLGPEAERVWELYQQGIIREIYFREDREEAVIVLECTDLKEATAALDTLPLVRNGLIAFELLPLKPYPGLARLFRRPPVHPT